MTRYWITALALLAGLFAATWTALHRLGERAEVVVAEEYQAQQLLVVRQAATRIDALFAGLRGRLADIARAVGDADELPPTPDLTGSGIVLLLHSPDGHVLDVSDHADPAFAERVRGHQHLPPDGAWDEPGDYCATCAEVAHKCSLSVPLPTGDGYVGALLDSDHLYEQHLRPIQGDHDGYFWALHDDGSVMLAPDPRFIGTRPFDDLPANQARLASVIRQMLAGRSGTSSYPWWDDPDAPGEERLVAFAPLAAGSLAYSSNRRSVVARMDSVQDHTSRTVLWLVVGFGAAALLLVVGAVAAYRRERAARNRVQRLSERRQRAQEALVHAQEQLLEKSRRAGIAEMATGLLHDVANATTSVLGSAQRLEDLIGRSGPARLRDATELIRQHRDDLAAFLDSERGRKVPLYLEKLAEQMQDDRTAVRDEAARLLSLLDHLVAVLQSRKEAAGRGDIVEVEELVDQALELAAASLDSVGARVHCDLASLPAVVLRRHRVLQILVNLLINAAHAIEQVPADQRRITVEAYRDGDRLWLAVSDDGPGIAPDTLDRIFDYGFTTKDDGQGFGLHSAAKAARDMGGSLMAHSDGLGHGATFALELPLDRAAGARPGDVAVTG